MRQDLKDDEYLPDMPDVDIEVVYLLTNLWEMGPVMGGGMAPVPVPQSEIMAWQSNNGIDLAPWEVRTIRALSVDYHSQYQASKKADEKAPWVSEVVERTRAVKAQKIKNLFRS